jgi:hypothetical protein
VLDGEIVAEADDLVDQEGGRLRSDTPRRGVCEQPPLDLGAPVVERRLEQRDHCAAALARIAGFGGDRVELARKRAAIDDRAARVELVEDVAHASSASSFLRR